MMKSKLFILCFLAVCQLKVGFGVSIPIGLTNPFTFRLTGKKSALHSGLIANKHNNKNLVFIVLILKL